VSLGIVEYRPGTGAATTALDHAISANPLYSLRKVSDLQEQHCLLGGGILFNSLALETDKASWCHKLDVMSLLRFGEFKSQDVLIESPGSREVFEIEFHADETEGGRCHRRYAGFRRPNETELSHRSGSEAALQLRIH